MKAGGILNSNDKFLPVWVILAMTLSVFLLSCQMTRATTEVCAGKGGCANPVASTAKPTVGASAAVAPGSAASAAK